MQIFPYFDYFKQLNVNVKSDEDVDISRICTISIILYQNHTIAFPQGYNDMKVSLYHNYIEMMQFDTKKCSLQLSASNSKIMLPEDRNDYDVRNEYEHFFAGG